MRKLFRGVYRLDWVKDLPPRKLILRRPRSTKPHTLFITCMDLRVDPYRLTRSEPGGLAILSNAGNIVPHPGTPDDAMPATIGADVADPEIRDIVICGHAPCLVMKALLRPDLPPNVAEWLRHAEAARRVLASGCRHAQSGRMELAAAEANVLAQLESLRAWPAVAARLAEGSLMLHAWVCKEETAEVFTHNPLTGRFDLFGDPGLSD